MGRKDRRVRQGVTIRGSRRGTALMTGLVVSLLARIALAEPTYVVDTGPGADTGGRTLSSSQYLAGQFTLDAGTEIEALEGWIIYPTIVGDLPVFAVLYGDADGVPDVDDEIYSQLFSVPASGIPFVAGWHGVDGLSLLLDGGTYWLSFEVPTATAGSGAMPPTPLQELDLYAIESGAGWIADETSNLGIRIRGTPEPGTVALLASAIPLLAAWGRRRRTPRPGA